MSPRQGPPDIPQSISFELESLTNSIKLVEQYAKNKPIERINADLIKCLSETSYSVLNDWELYLMGLIPKTSVTTTALIFNNQTTTPTLGFHATSEFTEYTINNLVATLGERVPNSTNSQKNFRVATIIVSDELLSANEMAYFHFMTLRADMTTSVPAAAGFAGKMGTPFYLATGGLATLNTSLTTAAVPIELTHFVGKIKDNNAELKWQTATEINIKNFAIEKSIDGNKFEKIAEIKSLKSNSSTPSVYEALDDQFSTSSYYRLKVNDLDGKFSFSKTILLEKIADKTLKIRSNTEGSVFIETNDKIELIALTNIIGQQLKTINQKEFTINDLPSGIYIISVKTNKGFLSQKVIKN